MNGDIIIENVGDIEKFGTVSPALVHRIQNKNAFN